MTVKMTENIDVSSLTLIGTGRTAEVYALDGQRVLKLYHRQIPRENAVRNYRLFQASKEAGIPVPAVYGMIETSGRVGMIMDRLILIIEETYIYIKRKVNRAEDMDVLIRRADEKAIMLFRKHGEAFNLVANLENDKGYNAALLEKIPDSVEYEYSIGMNIIKLVFNIGGKEAQTE